jgi:hypothetical protein
MFVRFEDSTAGLRSVHIVWKCLSVVCLSVCLFSVYLSVVCLSGLAFPDFSKENVTSSPRVSRPPEGYDVNAVHSFGTLGSSNPATQLHIPDDLSRQYYVHYTGIERKGFARSQWPRGLGVACGRLLIDTGGFESRQGHISLL